MEIYGYRAMNFYRGSFVCKQRYSWRVYGIVIAKYLVMGWDSNLLLLPSLPLLLEVLVLVSRICFVAKLHKS